MRFDREGRGLSAEKKSVVLVLILFADLLLISSQIILKNQQSLLQTCDRQYGRSVAAHLS